MPTGKIPTNRTQYIESIYSLYYIRLLNLAVKKGCKLEEAEDVVSIIFLRFLTILEKFKWQLVIRNEFSYLAKIVETTIINFRKKQLPTKDKIVNIDDEDEFFEPSDKCEAVKAMDDNLDNKEFFEKQILPLIPDFSEYEKQFVWFNFFEDYTAKDMAIELGQSYEKTHIDNNRTMSKFRYRLKKLGRDFF